MRKYFDLSTPRARGDHCGYLIRCGRLWSGLACHTRHPFIIKISLTQWWISLRFLFMDVKRCFCIYI